MSEPTLGIVLREFNLDLCEGGAACDEVECVGSRKIAGEVIRLRSAITLATQRAEAAEAERDAAGLDLADAAQHIGRGDALRATLRAEIEAVRAQRDAIDKLWADAVAELSRVDDDRIQRVIERDMLRKACSLFVEWLEREDAGSGIQADERGTPAGEAKFLAWYHGNLYLCQVAVESARAALAVQSTTEGM